MLSTRFVTGSPNWLDLGTPDIEAATAFYGGLFGWTFQSAGPEAGGYGMFQLDGKTAAGGMQVPWSRARPAGRSISRRPTRTPPRRRCSRTAAR